MFFSLDRIVFQPFFVLSPTEWSSKRNSKLYKAGHGEKSVIWYREFDMEKQYFHKFRPIDYAAALEFYTANKLTMWGKGTRKGCRQE